MTVEGSENLLISARSGAGPKSEQCSQQLSYPAGPACFQNGCDWSVLIGSRSGCEDGPRILSRAPSQLDRETVNGSELGAFDWSARQGLPLGRRVSNSARLGNRRPIVNFCMPVPATTDRSGTRHESHFWETSAATGSHIRQDGFYTAYRHRVVIP